LATERERATSFAGIGDLAVHYHLDGSADRPALVFSNSLGTDFRIWDRVRARLDGRYRTLCYDKRGHGLTDLTPGPYSIETLGADLIGLMDHLGIEQAVICGLSVGGLIAQEVAARQPARVQALILCDTAHKIGNDAMWNQRIETATGQGIGAMAEAILERWFSSGFHRDRQTELAGWRNLLTRTPAEGYAGVCAALRDADLTAAAGRIGVPTLCLVGEEDGATPPALVEELAGLVPGARFEVIAGAGHLPCIEQPDALAALITGFLEANGIG
jgi:3-oxoadipate enol-lactonase